MGPSKQDRGFSILEYVSILPILFGLIFGAIDVNNALQAYSVLREAVHTSLRCAYTVDGACVQASSDARVRLYDYFVSDSPTASIYREVDYRGEYRFFDLPILQFSNFSAQVLNQVLFDIPRYNYSGSVELTRLSNQVSYSRRIAEFPHIRGTDPRNPDIVYENGTSYPQSNYIQVSLANNRVVNLGDNQGGMSPWETLATLSIPPRTLSRNCFKANPNDQPSNGFGTNFTESCTLDEVEKLIFHAVGNSLGTDGDSCAKVHIGLRWQNSNGTQFRDLGGQIFRGPSASQNFYPRGDDLDWVQDSWQNIAEFIDHQNIPMREGTQYSLRFRMERLTQVPCNPGSTLMCSCANGLLSWTLGDVHTYSAVYQPVTTETVCDEQVPVGAPYAEATCTPSLITESLGHEFGNQQHRYPNSTLVSDASNPREKNPPNRIPTQFAPINNAFNEEHARQLLVDRGDIASNFVSSVALNNIGTGQIYSSPGVACGANFGVNDLPGADSLIRNSADALSLCPPSLPADVAAWVDSSSIQNVRWSETTRNLTEFNPVRWTMQNCFTEAPTRQDFPPELQQFPKLTWDGPMPSGLSEPYYTGPETSGFPPNDSRDPNYIKAHDPNYNCDLIQIHSVEYDDRQGNVPTDSLFRGLHPNHALCAWGSELRDEAVRLQMPEDAFFVPHSTYMNELESENPPNDSCTDWRLGTEQASSLTPVPNGPYAEGTTPAECLAQGVHCIARFHGFLGDATSHTTFDKETAAATGRAQLEAMLPWAKWNCEGPRCAKIELDTPQDASQVTVRGSVEVPMNLLLRKSVTVRYSGQESFEGIFSN